MRSSWDYAGFAQLCGRSAIMRKIMRAHNSTIPRFNVPLDMQDDNSRSDDPTNSVKALKEGG